MYICSFKQEITNFRKEEQMQYELNNQEEPELTVQNNRVELTGAITGEPVFSHSLESGEGFYELKLSVNRLSGMADIIPVTVPAELIETTDICIGSNMAVRGQFRSYNKIVGDRSKLLLTVFAHEIFTITEPSNNPNSIELTGYICKAPIYRTTPFNREIADLLIAVNRSFNKSDYIPIIAWGKNARFAKNLLVGEKINLSGRVQSREYQKRLDDGTTETRTAYEISINRLSRNNE